MSEWKEYKLGDLIDYKKGFAFQSSTYQNSGIPVVRVSDTTDNSIDILSCHKVNDEIAERCKDYRLFENDIIIATVGSWADNPNSIVGKVIRVPKSAHNALLNQNAVRLRSNGYVSSDMLYCKLKDKGFSDYLLNTAQGSANQASITLKDIFSYDILLPSIEEQERIAGILSSLDDKIDLLTRQNRTLEAMAETLFRHHFIDNPKPDWKDGVIADIAKHSKIAIHPQKQPTELFCHYSIPSFDNAKTPTLDLGVEIQSSKYKVPSNSILFSKLNPHKDKRVWLLPNSVHDNSICSTEFQIIEPINKEYLYFTYGWLTHSENYNDIASGVGGTSGSHQRIDPATIFSFTCPIIDIDYIRLYNSQVKPMFEKQINNQQQIRSLTKLRDTLLPKLMNNEIKI